MPRLNLGTNFSCDCGLVLPNTSSDILASKTLLRTPITCIFIIYIDLLLYIFKYTQKNVKDGKEITLKFLPLDGLISYYFKTSFINSIGYGST